MKAFHIFLCLVMAGVLIFLNRMFVPADAHVYGGLSWMGWVSMLTMAFLIGFIVIVNDSTRAFGFFRRRDEKGAKPVNIRTLTRDELVELKITDGRYRGPAYPHPVIFPERCIGCQACVDACPHDVLAIVDGRSKAVAPDLCMEDTACQAE